MKACRVFLLALCLTFGACQSTQEHFSNKQTREQALKTVSRIGVIGASLSAGFDMSGRIELAKIVDASLKLPHETLDTADIYFFMGPSKNGKEAIEKMEKFEPTLVFAIDFLFWFGYGSGWPSREERLKQGLKLVERLKCPVILGDLPDMSDASETILSKGSRPNEKLKKLNQIIYEWAKTKSNIHMVSLYDCLDCIKKGKPIKINGSSKTFKEDELMQFDKLHPNKQGRILVGVLCLERLVEIVPCLTRNDFILDMDELLKKFSVKNSN